MTQYYAPTPTPCAPQSWVKELHNLGPENIVIVLVGNKCDLESERVRWHSSQVHFLQCKSLLYSSSPTIGLRAAIPAHFTQELKGAQY